MYKDHIVLVPWVVFIPKVSLYACTCSVSRPGYLHHVAVLNILMQYLLILWCTWRSSLNLGSIFYWPNVALSQKGLSPCVIHVYSWNKVSRYLRHLSHLSLIVWGLSVISLTTTRLLAWIWYYWYMYIHVFDVNLLYVYELLYNLNIY